MFSGKVKFCAEMQRELMEKTFVIGLIGTAFGVICFLIFIGLAVLLNESDTWVVAFIASPVLLVLGIFLLVIYANSIKAVKKQQVVNLYEFFEDHFIISTIRNGENIGSVKLYYSE